MATDIDYNKVLQRFAAYKASDFKDLLGLSNQFTNKGPARVTQANTNGCQCVLGRHDIIMNFVENKVVGDLTAMLPAGASDREIVDEVFLGGTSLASLIHWASDDQWIRVINGRGRQLAQRLYRAFQGSMDSYHVRLIDGRTGNLLQGFITKNRGSAHIEAYLQNAPDTTLTVWYGYEKAGEMKFINVPL